MRHKARGMHGRELMMKAQGEQCQPILQACSRMAPNSLSNSKCRLQSTEYRIQSTEYGACTECRVQSTEYRVCTEYRVQSIDCRVQSTDRAKKLAMPNPCRAFWQDQFYSQAEWQVGHGRFWCCNAARTISPTTRLSFSFSQEGLTEMLLT